FLALGMLSLVEECVELVAAQEGTPPDLSRIDFADPAVYDRICRGDTVGLFQIESRAQIQMLRRTRPRNLEDLAVEVAIVRPGPIVGGAVNPYVRRREDQRRARRAGVHPGERLLRVRIPQVACRGVRAARLPVGVAPALSPGRVLLRALQQPADGILLARRAGTGREAQWGRDSAPRCERE